MSMKVTPKEDCWMCCLVPGSSPLIQLLGALSDKRDNYCQVHYEFAHKSNPFMQVVETDASKALEEGEK